MDTTDSIVKSAKSFFAGTALSRITGLLRDIAMAASFGTSPEIAAFMVSYRLANLFRRLLGEGNLQAGFVPHFASLKEEGGCFFRDVTYSLALILIALIAFLETVLWGIKRVVSPDWASIIELTMLMMPGLFFICLCGLNSSLLQFRQKYFIPSAAPIVFNLIWILAVFIKPNVTFLSLSITFAFAGQWFITVFEGAFLLPLKKWIRPRIFSKEFRKLIKPLLLGIFGIGAVQFNSALDTIFARLVDLKGPAFLWYAIRIQQLPLALFGIALSGAILPPLSRVNDSQKRKELLLFALKTASLTMLIATFGILSLGKEGISLLYEHGDFTRADVIETSLCLSAYGLGLVPSVLVLILATKSYSEKNYRTPMIASLCSVVINIGLNALFVFGFGLGSFSIALATSLSSCFNAYLLSKGEFTKEFWIFFFKLLLACLTASATVYLCKSAWEDLYFKDLFFETFNLFLLGIIFLSVFGVFSYIFKLNILSKIGLK